MKFDTKAAKGSVAVELITGSVNRFDGKTLFVAYGESKPLSRRKFVLAMRKIVAAAKQNKIKNFAVEYRAIKSLAPKDISDYDIGRVVGSAFEMADYEHNTFKTKPKDGWNMIDTAALVGIAQKDIEAIKHGHWIGKEVNAARELSNTPGGDMTPRLLAEAAKKAAQKTKIKVKALGRKEMEKLGMGAILGIAKGSAEEPQFIVMEYWGAPKSVKPVVMVGKGVTFDTGGLNLKPGDHMYEMHMDMSGGASVIHAVALAAKLKVKNNVIGLIPAVENNPGANAVRPGDVLKSLSGKTIEVLNTDAEGRVIMADAITYAKKYNPHLVVDVATLTGAALVALGVHASAFMVNDEAAIANVMKVAEESGDYMWPMPAWEEYEEMTKGHFADVPNISTAGNSRYGGVIAGGMFLKRFYDDLGCNWLHIDMAPRMTSVPGEHLAKGAAGAPVRFLLAIVEQYAHLR